MDGDGEFPTVCGTGTEDYFGGAWNWEQPKGEYCTYSTPFLGIHQVIKPDGLYRNQTRFGIYRWHVMDPIRFVSDLKVTIQDLGWRSGGDIYLSKAILHQPRSGTRRSRTQHSRSCRATMSEKLFNL